MKTLKGTLEFISLFQPIKLTDENQVLDLRDEYWKVFENLNGKSAKMKGGMNDLTICTDKKSEYNLEFEKKDESILIILKKKTGFGMANLAAYLPDMLQRLNGMHVIVTIDNTNIGITCDPDEKVLELNYTNGNSCGISDEQAKNICKIGQGEETCIFCTAGGQGFSCEKFNNWARLLLERYSNNEMSAHRIGNCKVVGRINNEY